MTGPDFRAAYDALLAEHQRLEPNAGCIQTSDCVACGDCVFCTGCERCYAARYSVGCSDSFDITHCTACTRCYACSFCKYSEHCAFSSYLVRCVACMRCDYCFGCVGLEKKHFHILNRKYSRKDYFAIVKELERTLAVVAW